MSFQSVMSSALTCKFIERSEQGRYVSLVEQIGVGV